MPCVRIPNGIATVSSPALRIRVDGKPWLFEDHPYMGPMPCRADGSERRATAAFWRAVTCWAQGGRRIGADGWCVWTEPEPDDMTGMVQIGKRTFAPAEMVERLRAKKKLEER